MESVQDRIKARRKELCLSADQVAAALGVSRATVYRYESAEIEKLPAVILKPLSEVLHTTPAYLMGWDIPDSASTTPDLTPDEADLLGLYRAVIPVGQEHIMSTARMVAGNPDMQKDAPIHRGAAI